MDKTIQDEQVTLYLTWRCLSKRASSFEMDFMQKVAYRKGIR